MPTNEMQSVVADPLGDRRARREAHDDAKADQHRERAEAPPVDRPPPTRHQALVDPGEFHPRRPPLTLPLARAPSSPRSRSARSLLRAAPGSICYRSFSVARPAIARIQAMIQKRITIV